MQCNYNSLIQIINFHGLSRNALSAEKLVPVEYWCSYARAFALCVDVCMHVHVSLYKYS